MKVYDISVPLRLDMPTYEGEPGPTLEFRKLLSKGDSATVSVLSLGSHTGTHVDAPSHFLEGAHGVEELPLDALVGPAYVAEFTGNTHITATDLDSMAIPADCERLLFKTRNSVLWDDPEFHTDFIALAPDAGRKLAERDLRLVGIDYLSIERFGASPHEVHETLLAGGVVILEGLDLRHVTPGGYFLVCAPLNVVGAEGAPARTFLIDQNP
ncbi:MAG: cyclase family protein [Chloroflexi bacterium]|nr:cyclase family protein [Chloroflexota bacterium]